MDKRIGGGLKSTHDIHEELPAEHEDNFIKVLHSIIHFAVRILAVLMVAVILWGVADVLLVMYGRLMAPPFMLLTVSDILAMFSAFLVVLIAIEIFLNITLYIRKDVFPIKLVVATALMAVSRKIIVFDFN
ncbi:MAG: phosphate-starvation-inducible PsiE family protein, partial [Methylococcaceae bacterium]|nr:phosphate-starvation-inducible PsiE family protein [Methylococcaceae bacterium]